MYRDKRELSYEFKTKLIDNNSSFIEKKKCILINLNTYLAVYKFKRDVRRWSILSYFSKWFFGDILELPSI